MRVVKGCDIRLALLGDPAQWESEAAQQRALLEDATASWPLQGSAREVADLLDSIVSQAAPPTHIAATNDILSSGYLNTEPHLRQ